MRRSWVVSWLAPPLVAVAALAGPTGVPASPAGTASGDVDPVALAAATTAASWNCMLPHRGGPSRTQLRATGPALRFAESERTADPAQGSVTAPWRIDGLGTGPGQTPSVEITGTLADTDQVDVYQVPMRAGEVLGATVRGAAARLEVHDPSGALMEGSAIDRSAIYPVSTSLPAGGDATVDHVASVSGVHTLQVHGRPKMHGEYQVQLGLRLPPKVGPQRLVLEFGDTTVDTTRFGVRTEGPQPKRLSGLRAFLPRWGLRASDEPALIKQISETVAENLRGPTGEGVGPVRVETVSDGSPSPFGQPNVSRVVIGGSRAEAALDTVGIAESVDPGNLVREETALVLLDSLSGSADRVDSLNHYLAPGSDRVAFIGRAIGNIVSHEAGHLLGSWHTDPDSAKHDLMAPGDLIGAFGFGADRLGGTPDDTRVKFGQDTFAPAEGFTGTEDTRARTTVGLGGTIDGSVG